MNIDEDWEELQFECNQGDLQFCRKTIEPGEEVAKVIMGLLFYEELLLHCFGSL